MVLKPGSFRRAIQGWNRAGLKKKQGKKKPGVTQWVTRQDPVANLLTFIFFVFLLKRRRFDLKKKELTQPIR
jgi:hypothetical protein